MNAEGVLCSSNQRDGSVKSISVVSCRVLSIDTELVDGCLVGVGVCLSVSLTDCVLGAFDKYV